MIINHFKPSINKKVIFFLFLISYFIYNSIHLLDFFYVHSDETWLIGLSKSMFENKNLRMTEAFFDLYPRTIHALRLFYVFLQGLFTQIFDNTIYGGRMLSLISGIGSLYFLKQWLSKHKVAFSIQLLTLLLIGFQLQFMMTIHSARQESLILFAMVLCLNYYNHKYSPYILGMITGLSISIHPNSFLIFSGLLALMVYDLIRKTISIKKISLYILNVSLWALLFITLSLLLNNNFIDEYINYGRSLGVVDFNISRPKGFYYYYYKIYHMIAGTYFLVNNKVILILSFLSYMLALLLMLFKKNKSEVIIQSFFMVTGINIGLIIIGRYNQTSIIFPLFFFFLLIIAILLNLKIKTRIIQLLLIGLLAYQLSLTFNHINHQAYDSQTYLKEALEVIPENSVILGNINLLNHFEDSTFYDYRNLWHLSGHEVLDYIEKRKIEYILWPEEMSYIYPQEKWHILYGPMAYYPTLVTFLDDQTLVKVFESKTYGNRISRYVNTYPWKINIYKVHSY
jgi:hypothetical protein